jgi:hypothetical protein
MPSWTLAYDGTERELSAWGLVAESVQLDRSSTAADVLTVRQAANDCLATLTFAYDAAVIVYRDRVGSGTSWSGGSIYFSGRATVPTRSGNGPSESVNYRFHGPWFDLEHQIFHQSWTWYTGSPPAATTYSTCEVFLGRNLAGAALNTGAQITEALNWAITCGVSLQIGTIDPAVNIFYINARSITCAEVIRTMLRNTPDAVCWFDYTTTPPTFHCRQLANLTALTVTLGTEKFAGLDLTPRYDLQVPSVLIHFKQSNEVDGQIYINWTHQAAPSGATGQERGGEVHVVELEGFSRTTVRGSLTCAAIDAQSGTAATRLAWWKRHNKLLESTYLTGVAVTSATVTDDDGNTVNLATYPNELLEGQIASWMSFAAKTVTIKALVDYELFADTSHTSALKLQTVKAKEISVRVTATDATTGDYSAVASFTAGETAPSGLADAYYAAMQTLQYAGSIALVAEDLPTTSIMGKKLTLAGSALTLTNQLIQGVTEQPHYGRYTITIGPSSRLGIQDLVERHNATRFRRIYNLPTSRTSGLAGGGSDVALGKNTARENTTGGLGERAVNAQSATDGSNKNLIIQDATGKALTMVVRDAAGADVTTAGKILLELSRTYGVELKIREAKVCEGGATKYCLTLASASYTTKKITAETPIGGD